MKTLILGQSDSASMRTGFLDKSRILKDKKLSTLFVTYDGLLDPLGGSQILPYLYSISAHPRGVHVISFEKSERFREGAERLRAELQNKGIRWTPLSFTSRFGKLGKVWDLLKMYLVALLLQLRYRFQVVHCRSYQAMQIGCFLRRFGRVKTIFDMRGLWVDDRIDRNIWRQDRWVYRFLYRHYKRVEKRLVESADSVLVLTEQVIPAIREIAPNISAPITVIPCCADFEHFEPLSENEKIRIRAELGIARNDLVISYLGSLGSLYLLDEMLKLFKAVAVKRNNVHLILITKDWSEFYESKLLDIGMSDFRDRIHIKTASRDEVPRYLGASDAMLNFIRPTFSMKACSPTKMAEALAMGIPVISTAGVGDVDLLTQELDAGEIINPSDPTEFDRVNVELESIVAKGGNRLRLLARDRLGLEYAKRAYEEVYEQLEVKA